MRQSRHPVLACCLVLNLIAPDLSMADLIHVRESHLPALTKALAPVKPFRDKNGRPWFYGRIIRIVPGRPGGRYSDPSSHRRYLFRAHSRDGRTKSHRPVLVSQVQIQYITREFDNLLDIRQLISNRHELMKRDISDPVYRQTLYRQFDPDGRLGLYRSGALTISGRIAPGKLDSLINKGYIPVPNPWLIPPALKDSIENQWKRMPWTNFMSGLIMGIARSKRYPNRFNKEFRKQALATAGLLTTFARVNPDLAPPELRHKASRLYKLGSDSIKMLSLFLGVHPDRRHRNLPVYRHPALPVTDSDKAEAAADVIAREPGLRLFIGQTLLTHRSTSAKLAHALVYMAGVSNRLKQAAERAWANLLANDPKVDETNRNRYRQILFEHIFSKKHTQRTFVCQLLARYGWGNPAYLQDRLVPQMFDISFTYLRRHAEQADEMTRIASSDLVRCLRLMRTTLRKRHASVMQAIDRKISFIRQSMKTSPIDRQFMRLWHDSR